MNSSLLNNDKALKANKELANDLIIVHDKWKLKLDDSYGKYIGPLITNFMSSFKRLQAANIFVFNHTLSSPIDEYIKTLTLLSPEFFFNYKDSMYFSADDINSSKKITSNIPDTGFGIILDVKSPMNLNLYDNFKYFVINGDEIKKQEVSKELRKTLIKINNVSDELKKNNNYNSLMMVISNNITITPTLLRNISNEFELDYDKMIKELDNEQPVIPKLIHELPIMLSTYSLDTNTICIPIIMLRLYTSVKEQIDSLMYIFDATFDKIEEYLETNFLEYVRPTNSNSNLFKITTSNRLIHMLIKTLFYYNINAEIARNNVLDMTNKNTDVFSTENLKLAIENLRLSVKDNITDIITKINKELSI